MITQKYLRYRVERLNKVLGRPEAAWTSTDGKLIANVGHIALEAMSPGDGWTRYRLVVIDNVNGGENNIGLSCTASEMAALIEGICIGLDLAGYAATPDLLAACESVIAWAKSPGDHRRNPYTEPHVKACMTAVAKVRGVDKWSL